ncbi:hypothetical protein AAG906_034867 [Vitis piasezkii]
MFLSCSIVQCLSGDNRYLDGKNRSNSSSFSHGNFSRPWIFPDSSSKAECAVCNMLGLLLSDPGKLPFATELCFENEVVLPQALSFGLVFGTKFRAGFFYTGLSMFGERDREESPYEVYLLVAATQKKMVWGNIFGHGGTFPILPSCF